MTEDLHQYKELLPSSDLVDFVDSYFEVKNLDDKSYTHTILPDSYFKLIIERVNNKFVAYFLTGLWSKEIEIVVPANCVIYGIRFKILAPEYIFKREVASILQSHEELDISFWDIHSFSFESHTIFAAQIEEIIRKKRKEFDNIEGKKFQLSQILYFTNGDISASKVCDQIAWSSRQINRYLNKYLGVSLKTYLNIQKCYAAFIQIREGRFFPDGGYFDQAHFIKEIKKHTNHTPTELHKKQHDRFIQLRNIKRK